MNTQPFRLASTEELNLLFAGKEVVLTFTGRPLEHPEVQTARCKTFTNSGATDVVVELENGMSLTLFVRAASHYPQGWLEADVRSYFGQLGVTITMALAG